MVYGDRRPYLVGLIVPDDEFVATWAREQGKPANLEDLADDVDFRVAVGKAIDRVNKSLSNTERVRRFTVAKAAFTTDNEMMTPTLKIRRHKILELYRPDLEALYEKK